jgi:hypothetical protein
MKPTLLYTIADSDPIGRMRLCANGPALILRFDYLGKTGSLIGAVRFDEVFAFRFCDEHHSHGWVEESYCAVVCIDESPWQQYMLRIEPKPPSMGRTVANASHFAVMLESCGYIEVLAGKCTMLPTTAGELGDIC